MNEAIAGMALIGALITALIGTVVQAVILRAAVAMYNRLSGANKPTEYDEEGIPYAKSADAFEGVPEPSMPQAMGICFAVAMINAIVGFVVGVWENEAAFDLTTVLIIRFSGVALSLFVMAVVLASALPTYFNHAIMVTLCHLLISILIAVPIVLFAMYVFKFGLF